MKNMIFSTAIFTAMTLSASLVHAQEVEPKINRIQLKEQVREAVQSSANHDANQMKTERQQSRISQNTQTVEAARKMEQKRYQNNERKQYEQRKKSHHDSSRSSHYGQGYESRARSMGASSRAGSSGHSGRR